MPVFYWASSSNYYVIKWTIMLKNHPKLSLTQYWKNENKEKGIVKTTNLLNNVFTTYYLKHISS